MHDERTDFEMTSTETTRRRLLFAATAGFALAASGLFLPDRLEETAAREGVLGGAMGGRHGKNHKGRQRHRRHGDKDKHKNKKKDRRNEDLDDQGLFRSTALTVTNHFGTNRPLECTFYYRIKTGLDSYGPPRGRQSAHARH